LIINFKSSIQRELDSFFKAISKSDFKIREVTKGAFTQAGAKLNPGDLLLLERGYPCFWLLFLLKTKGIEFCVRLKDNWRLKVTDFTESDEKERIVTFTLPKKDRKKLADFPHMQDATITCRLIKIELSNGEKEILCTSLIDTEKYLHEEFDKLYHSRWNASHSILVAFHCAG
jgi:hypothetical protein